MSSISPNTNTNTMSSRILVLFSLFSAVIGWSADYYAQNAPILPTKNLPKSFDWREKGAVTPVKDQDDCSSCWAFAATGVLEGANYLANAKLLRLSEQQLLDCDHQCNQMNVCDQGCIGGLDMNALEYIFHSGGVMLESEYGYKKKEGSCNFKKSRIAASISNFSLVSVDEQQIAANLVKNGPLAVSINADEGDLSSYTGGIFCPSKCDGNHLDHDVLLVGYEEEYWIVKNSWGKNWGDKGYFKICRRKNACGINNLVITVHAGIRNLSAFNSSGKVGIGFSAAFSLLFSLLCHFKPWG